MGNVKLNNTDRRQTTISVKPVTRSTRQPRNWVLISVLLVLAGGCSHSVQEPEIPLKIPESFSGSGTAALPEEWWRAFKDDELNALIDEALTDNFDLRIAWDRLAQAQALARKTDALLWPQADLMAGASRTRQETGDMVSYSSLYSVGLAATYEVDLWSRLGSTRKAAWLDVQAQREAVDTAAITLAAAIANTWYQLAEAKTLVRIAREQIEANQQVLDIVTVQFRKGMASAADVLRQRQLVASTEAQLIAAEETVDLLQYQISALIGNQPELAWEQTSINLPDLPPMPKLGVPADVLWRRPDVRQGYRQVQTADQYLAVAIANQYPRISISANAETASAVSVRDLFDDWLANLAANAIQPLFDGSQRKAEVQRQKAIVSERIHMWGQAILDALQDVETALTRQQQQTQLLENLKHQLSLARETYQRNRASYIKGQVDYIRVLESLQSLQSLERNVVRAQSTLIQHRIDLYRSIAGPYEVPQPSLTQTSDLTEAGASSGNFIQDKWEPL